MREVDWDIRRDGHAWEDEADERCALTPEKFEMWEGRLRSRGVGAVAVSADGR